jgi:hypothetical protein
MPFQPEPPTKPETWRAVLRQLSERVRASSPGDVALLTQLRLEARHSARGSEQVERYRDACERFVDRILG